MPDRGPRSRKRITFARNALTALKVLLLGGFELNIRWPIGAGVDPAAEFVLLGCCEWWVFVAFVEGGHFEVFDFVSGVSDEVAG